jgi:outer membrane protein OmpA-like peptidoglycan-associated protein
MSDMQVLSGDHVQFTRLLPASREQVWAMLSDAPKLESWFLPVAALDPQVGGRYNIPSDNGALDGVLTEFDPPQLINFNGSMRFELSALEDAAVPATTLRFTLARDTNGWIPSTLASCETMLDNLALLLAGEPAMERPATMRAWRLYSPVCEQALSVALAGGKKIVHRVTFPANADEPTGELAELKEIVRLLQHNRALRVAVDGFADEPLDRKKAFALSQRRAGWARAQLIACGIEADRILTRAFGNYYRLHPGRDEPSTALNRRVELIPLY